MLLYARLWWGQGTSALLASKSCTLEGKCLDEGWRRWKGGKREPEIMVATQDSISLSSEGSGGWGPGHNRLQYLSSWEIEKNIIYKEYIKNTLEK